MGDDGVLLGWKGRCKTMRGFLGFLGFLICVADDLYRSVDCQSGVAQGYALPSRCLRSPGHGRSRRCASYHDPDCHASVKGWEWQGRRGLEGQALGEEQGWNVPDAEPRLDGRSVCLIPLFYFLTPFFFSLILFTHHLLCTLNELYSPAITWPYRWLRIMLMNDLLSWQSEPRRRKDKRRVRAWI